MEKFELGDDAKFAYFALLEFKRHGDWKNGLCPSEIVFVEKELGVKLRYHDKRTRQHLTVPTFDDFTVVSRDDNYNELPISDEMEKTIIKRYFEVKHKYKENVEYLEKHFNYSINNKRLKYMNIYSLLNRIAQQKIWQKIMIYVLGAYCAYLKT